MSNIKSLLSELRGKQLLSDQAVSNFSSSFGENALALVARCINRKAYKTVTVAYPVELVKFCIVVVSPPKLMTLFTVFLTLKHCIASRCKVRF